MNSTLSYAHAYAVASDCVFRLQMSMDGPEPFEFYRPTLRECVRKLRFTAKLFLAMGWAIDYPHLYMPIADALISIKEALRSTKIDHDGIACAAYYLERIVLIDPRKGGRKDAA